MRFRNKQLRITLHNYDLVLSKLATGRGRRASERQVPSVFPLGTDTYGEVRNSLYNPTEGFEGYEPRRGIRRGALAPGLAWQSSMQTPPSKLYPSPSSPKPGPSSACYDL